MKLAKLGCLIMSGIIVNVMGGWIALQMWDPEAQHKIIAGTFVSIFILADVLFSVLVFKDWRSNES